MKQNKLKQISHELTSLYANDIASEVKRTGDGEDFHSKYKDNKEIFRKLVKSDVALERGMKKYFSELATRVVQSIDWGIVNSLSASINDYIHVDWDEEDIFVKVLLTDSLISAINAGGELTQLELGIDIGWSSKDAGMIDFLNKYTLKLSGKLGDTTKDIVKEALKSAISNHETQAEAVERITGIVNNPVRAKMIAHTESIRAFSAGRLEVGRQVGAQYKEWDATLGACSICAPLDGIRVPLNKNFPGGFFLPPAHANCRCIENLIMPESGKPQENDFDLTEVWNDYPFN